MHLDLICSDVYRDRPGMDIECGVGLRKPPEDDIGTLIAHWCLSPFVGT